jgi:group I intron endonuclease
MKTHYTYSHNKPDGTPFYIGKGSGNRAFTKRTNPYWKNIVAKYGYEVQILAHWKTHEEALNHEILIIACMKDMGIKLANMTEGGEGTLGFSHPHTEEHKKKLKGNSYGASSWGMTFKGKKHSTESRAKMSYVRIGNKNKLGAKLSNESKERISKGKTGKIVLAKRVLTAEQVLEIRPKIGYRNIAMLAREYGVSESTIRRIRDGERYGDIK